ncbi:MAG TPA: hypothetical protein VIO37_07195 [Candidatus Dormibacteraeota bacterium]
MGVGTGEGVGDGAGGEGVPHAPKTHERTHNKTAATHNRFNTMR